MRKTSRGHIVTLFFALAATAALGTGRIHAQQMAADISSTTAMSKPSAAPGDAVTHTIAIECRETAVDIHYGRPCDLEVSEDGKKLAQEDRVRITATPGMNNIFVFAAKSFKAAEEAGLLRTRIKITGAAGKENIIDFSGAAEEIAPYFTTAVSDDKCMLGTVNVQIENVTAIKFKEQVFQLAKWTFSGELISEQGLRPDLGRAFDNAMNEIRLARPQPGRPAAGQLVSIASAGANLQ
jgi:hypothetical protein